MLTREEIFVIYEAGPEAVKTVFPEVSHYFCVYHQLKNVSKKYSEEFKPGDEIPIDETQFHNPVISLFSFTLS